MNKLQVTPAPFLHTKRRPISVMAKVILALLPAAVTGCLNYGIRAAMLLGLTVAAAVLTEALVTLICRRPESVLDGSAIVTGLILGMMLPPDFPFHWAAAGSVFAILIVKQLFGGIGRNFANPALTAKTALMLAFMTQMHQFTVPGTHESIPAGAVSASWWDLFLGNVPGCIGETCALGLLAGGVFLCLTGTISAATPLAYLSSFALLTFLWGGDPVSGLLSGGLMLCAFFAACDYTTTPLSRTGKAFFGLGCGCLTFLIRQYGGYEDGAALAVLMMDLLTPLLDRITLPRPFGAVRPAKKRRTAAN